jgi:hypothetical protein
MTKEDVLQKANDYCTEKAYTETLTDEFKDKFSDFFSKKYQDTDAEDETMIADLKFNLDTAFSATSKGITSKQKAFEDKENEYKNQIAELTKKLGKRPQEKPLELPKELQDQLDELKVFKNKEAKKEKFANIVEIAKASVRQDLHKSLENYAKDFDVALDKEDADQAKSLVSRFQEIFKDTIGDTKPLAPKTVEAFENEILGSVKKIEL